MPSIDVFIVFVLTKEKILRNYQCFLYMIN